MEIVFMAIDSITPYARNARKIPAQAIEKVAASLGSSAGGSQSWSIIKASLSAGTRAGSRPTSSD
jgi:hypothetical protein